MPALDASIASIRERYDFKTYITTPTETVIFRALVNQATFTYPITALTFDTVTVGAFGDILQDEEVIVYNQSTNTIKGRLRVASGVATSTVLQINEIGQGRIDVANNDKIEVLRSWRVRDKLVGATATFPKDSRLAYSDQGANPQPVANSGGHWAGFVVDGTSAATVQFTGSTSYTVDPDSAGTVTHSWTFGDGTPSTSTSADPSVSFPVGERWISHTVTDSSNSKTETQYVYVGVFNHSTSRPTDCQVDEMSASVIDGWRCRVTVPAGWTTTQAPDGALCIVWERETYGGTVTSFGANTSGRSHIKFVGYMQNDTITHDYRAGTVSFDLINPVALLAQLPGFSQVLNTKASPVNWRQLKTLTTNRALIYLLRWGTTLLRVHDFILAGNNYSYPQLYVQAQTPDTQIREITDGIASTFICDRRGRVAVQLDLLQATSAQRSAATTTLTLTSADIVAVEFTRDHRYAYNTLEGRGFVAGTTIKAVTPVLSLAPGKAPSEAPQKTVVERMIVTNQSDLNIRTGFLYAKQNLLSSGLPTSRGSITLAGNFDVFDTYAEWLALTLSTTYNKRGLSFSAARFVITGISIEYNNSENASKRVRLTVQEETTGAAGVTKNAPVPQKNNLPSVTIPRIDFPYFIPTAPSGNSTGAAVIQALLQSTTRYNTTDFNAYSVTWSSSSTAGISGTVYDWVVDAFTIGTASVNAKVVTSSGIYDVTDLFGTPTATLRHTFTTALTNTAHRRIYATRGVQNHFVVISFLGSAGTQGTLCTYTTNGTSWTESTISSHYNTTVAGLAGTQAMYVCGAISEHVPGVVYAGAFTATGAAQAATSALYRSVDYGATWAAQSGMTNARWSGLYMHFPYHDNSLATVGMDDRFMYWTKCDTASTNVLMRTDRLLGTQTAIDPSSGGQGGGICVHTCAINRQRLAVVTRYASGSNFAIGVSVSRDAGNNWTELVVPTVAANDRWINIEVGGDNPDVLYLMGEAGKVGYSTNFGALIYNKNIGVAADVAKLTGS